MEGFRLVGEENLPLFGKRKSKYWQRICRWDLHKSNYITETDFDDDRLLTNKFQQISQVITSAVCSPTCATSKQSFPSCQQR